MRILARFELSAPVIEPFRLLIVSMFDESFVISPSMSSTCGSGATRGVNGQLERLAVIVGALEESEAAA